MVDATTSRRTRKRLDALTSLRFVAAGMILLHHLKGNMGVPASMPYNLQNGLGFGVSFFFLLSGFIVAYNYPSLPDWQTTRLFLIKRFARLWPAHATALLFTLIIAPGYAASLVSSPAELSGRIVLVLAMVQTWIPFEWLLISINDPSWSIATEFAFYLAFPLLIANFARSWWWKLGAAVLFLGLIMYLCQVFKIPAPTSRSDGLTITSVMYIWPGVRIFEFIAGMCTALAWQRLSPKISPGRTITGTAVELAAMALFVLQVPFAHAFLATIRKVITIPANDAFHVWYFVTAGCTLIPGCILIFMMALEKGWLSRVLSVWPLVLLGEMSYSIYLLHFPVLRSNLQNLPTMMALPDLVRLTITLSTVFVVSFLVWAYVERPARRFIVKMASRGTPPFESGPEVDRIRALIERGLPKSG